MTRTVRTLVIAGCTLFAFSMAPAASQAKDFDDVLDSYEDYLEDSNEYWRDHWGWHDNYYQPYYRRHSYYGPRYGHFDYYQPYPSYGYPVYRNRVGTGGFGIYWR